MKQLLKGTYINDVINDIDEKKSLMQLMGIINE